MELKDLAILTESFARVGKRYLNTEELSKFIMDTLQHEALNLKERTKLYEKEEIIENEINTFDFFNDGYRYGVFIHLTDDNTLTAGYDDDNEPVKAKELFKKDRDGEFMYDDDGDKISTKRALMRFKSRMGSMGIFISLSMFKELEKDHYYVFVGSLQTQWKDLDSNKYVKEKEDGIKYSDPTFTLNIWQFGEIVKKGQKLAISMPEVNFKREEE